MSSCGPLGGKRRQISSTVKNSVTAAKASPRASPNKHPEARRIKVCPCWAGVIDKYLQIYSKKRSLFCLQALQFIIKTANTTLVLRFTPIPESINSHTLVQYAIELIHEPTQYIF